MSKLKCILGKRLMSVGIILFSLIAGINSAWGAPKWVTMIYFDADNDLTKRCKYQIDQVMKFKTNNQLKLIVLMDKLGDGNTSLLVSDDITYELGTKSLTELNPVYTGNELSMNKGQTLEDFVKYGMKFEGEYYMLIIKDHSGAWKGCCNDKTTGGGLISLPALKDALKNALGGRKIDILCFDCCLMSSIEVGYQLRECVTYMIASEGKTKSNAWRFDNLLNGLKGLFGFFLWTPTDVINKVRKFIYFEYQKDIMVYDLNNLEEIASKAQAFGKELLSKFEKCKPITKKIMCN